MVDGSERQAESPGPGSRLGPQLVRKNPFRTVRCILHQENRFLLVLHRGPRFGRRGRWGLPGGRIEAHESFEDAARREIREELGVLLGPLLEVGDYRYKGALHKVFATAYSGRIISFQRAELRKIGWHTLDEVSALGRAGHLHAGFEDQAISDFLRRRQD